MWIQYVYITALYIKLLSNDSMRPSAAIYFQMQPAARKVCPALVYTIVEAYCKELQRYRWKFLSYRFGSTNRLKIFYFSFHRLVV